MTLKLPKVGVFTAAFLLFAACDNSLIIDRYLPETPETPDSTDEETAPVISILGGLAMEGAIFIDSDEELLWIGTEKAVSASKVYSSKGIVYDGATYFTDGKKYPQKIYSMSATYILRGNDLDESRVDTSTGARTFAPQGNLPLSGQSTEIFTGKLYGYYDDPAATIIYLCYPGLFKDIGGSAEVSFITFNYNSAKYWITDTTASTVFSAVYSGAIAQKSTSGTPKFTNLRLKGTVTVAVGELDEKEDDGAYAGGYIGLAEAGLIFASCTSNLTLLSMSGKSVKPFYAGGFVGKAAGSVQFDFTPYDTSVTALYNAPIISCSNDDGNVYAGGVAGFGVGRISGAEFGTGGTLIKITAKSGEDGGDVYAGGLAGYFSGKISNSNVKAASAGSSSSPSGVNGSSTKSVYSGGVVGLAAAGNNGSLDTVKFTGGGVWAWSGASDVAFPTGYAGGVAGYTQVNLNSCGATSPTVNGRYMVGGTSYAGGIAGAVASGAVLYSCTAASPLVASCRDEAGGTSVAGSAYAGGIAGSLRQGKITLSSVTGTPKVSAGTDAATNTSSTYTISAEKSVAGGIAGIVEGSNSTISGSFTVWSASSPKIDARAENGFAASGGIAGQTVSGSAIETSWAGVDIYAQAGKKDSPPTNAYAGGLVGLNGGTKITDSFALSSVSIEVNANGESGGWAGGIAGLHDLRDTSAWIVIERCYAGGRIYARTNDYATKPAIGDFSGPQAFGGGITGGVALSTTPSSVQTNLVTNCFALQLTSDAVKNGYQRAHRIVGDITRVGDDGITPVHEVIGQFSGNISFYNTREKSSGDRLLGGDGAGNDWDGSTSTISGGTLNQTYFAANKTSIFENLGLSGTTWEQASTSGYPFPRPAATTAISSSQYNYEFDVTTSTEAADTE